MTKNYPKWEDIYERELTLQALFEKLIDEESRMKDEILILEDRINQLEWKLGDRIFNLESKIDELEYKVND